MNSTIRSLIAILLAAVAVSSPAVAGPLTFDFEFSDEFSAGDTVSGRILGLEDNLADQAATQIIIDDVTDGLVFQALVEGLDVTTLANQVANSFTVTDGVITDATFEAFEPALGGVLIFCINRDGCTGPGSVAMNYVGAIGIGDDIANADGLGGVTFSVVPGPAPAALLLGGLIGLAAARRIRRARR